MKNYVKEYKGYKVPKGATHYGNSHPVAYFYKFNAVKIPFFYLNHEWKRSSACDVYIKDNLTELPEAPQEWAPEVGDICEIKELGVIGAFTEWSKVYVDSINIKSNSSVQICCIDDNGDFAIFYPTYDSVKFRPLKTQQEKDREAFIECVKQLLPKSDTDDLILSGKLFDLGFTAPKAGDNE